ncbi:unnamed protein product [Eruca vesicaria subsp. sativa]|uniref:BHLH domain-containing protein n=1 Tax=Eruca vesicaria subsp. sativa TaxID=29727 RepID=A0ABC8J3D0_ERUVS|nr:unnamed protein product [Eruca vesicaria subsp. sativa]
MNKNQESIQYWSSLLKSFADSDPKDDLSPEISSPILVMSTSMAIDVLPNPSNSPGDGEKNINEGAQRFTDIEMEKIGEKEEMKNLGKRPRSNEARNIAEKRRRSDIKTKLENLKQLTPNCKKRDIASTLDCIVEHIRSMKSYVESMSPMLPLGMNMDFPAPWFPHIPPNLIMSQPSFNSLTRGETSENFAENPKHCIDIGIESENSSKIYKKFQRKFIDAENYVFHRLIIFRVHRIWTIKLSSHVLETILQITEGTSRAVTPKDVTKKSDQRDKKDHCNKNNHATKRQRSMEYRVLMEKKRRQLIRDKVDILQELTPNCAKSDLATKLESIVEYIKSLKFQIDVSYFIFIYNSHTHSRINEVLCGPDDV